MPLIVMPSNQYGHVLKSLSRRFPGRLGHMFSPDATWKTPFLPYSIDNGAFGAFKRGKPFDEGAFEKLVNRALAYVKDGGPGPRWLAVPDVVGNAPATIASWEERAPALRRLGWPLAFVVQDGMMARDVPKDADLIFVGGTLGWKWSTVHRWCSSFPRVHVGRVNRPEDLELLDSFGAESCDGTGWFRGNRVQLRGLVDFLEGKTRGRLFDTESLTEGICGDL